MVSSFASLKDAREYSLSSTLFSLKSGAAAPISSVLGSNFSAACATAAQVRASRAAQVRSGVISSPPDSSGTRNHRRWTPPSQRVIAGSAACGRVGTSFAPPFVARVFNPCLRWQQTHGLKTRATNREGAASHGYQTEETERPGHRDHRCVERYRPVHRAVRRQGWGEGGARGA